MRLSLAILFIALSVFASPPIPQAVHSNLTRSQLHPCTNCPPPIVYVSKGNITWAWDASISTNIDHYNFYMSPTFRPWAGVFVGSTSNLWYTYPCTGAAGFPGVSAVDVHGHESGITI